jgi:chromosome partitioning protein
MRIALVSQKGGVSKSTLAVSLAWEFHERGKRVLLVDADPQATCRDALARAEQRGRHGPTVVGMGAELYRKEQLPRLAQGFDHVILDTPGRVGDVQRAALLVADVALVPVSPSGPDAWALEQTLQAIEEARKGVSSLKAALIITRQIPRSTIAAQARAALEDLGRSFGVPVFRAGTHNRTAWAEASTEGMGVAQHAPRSVAAEELRAVVLELEQFQRKGRR